MAIRRRAIGSGLRVAATWLRCGGRPVVPACAGGGGGRALSGGEGGNRWRPPPSADFAETRKSSDPNVFRGPGGYTAAELFQQLRRAEAKDPGDEAGGRPSEPQVWPDEEQLQQMSIRELQSLLGGAGVGFSDCLDKESLIERARDSRPPLP